MKRLNVAQIKSLMTVKADPCISIYLPLNFGPEIRSRILKQGERQLLSFYSRQKANELMGPINDLVETLTRDRTQGTLCIFKSETVSGYTISCEDFMSGAHVSPQFHLKPLLNVIQGQRDFHILVINDESADLIKCNSNEYQVVWTSGARLFSGRTKAQALDYLERVGVETYLLENKFASQLSAFAELSLKISSFLKSDEPFFLCASRKNATQFRLVSDHSNLMPGLIANQLASNYRNVFLQGLDIVKPYWQNQEYDLLAHVLQQKASEKLITDIEKILAMIEDKKVSSLFVSKDSFLWGEIHRKNSSAKISSTDSTRNADSDLPGQVQDLAEVLANRVLQSGKQVHLVESKWLGGAAVAALKEGMLDSTNIIPLNRIWFNPKGNLLDLRK